MSVCFVTVTVLNPYGDVRRPELEAACHGDSLSQRTFDFDPDDIDAYKAEVERWLEGVRKLHLVVHPPVQQDHPDQAE